MKPIAMFPIAPPLRDDIDQAPVAQQVEDLDEANVRDVGPTDLN